MLHQYNRLESFIRAQTKPPQSCEERNPAPPNEEQFNAPTASGHAMNPIATVLTSIGNSRKAHGPPRSLEQDNITYRMLHPCNKRDSFIRAHTKPPQSCGFATIRLLLMRSSLMPRQQAAALGIMQVCLPWVICITL